MSATTVDLTDPDPPTTGPPPRGTAQRQSRAREQLLELWLPRIGGYVAFLALWEWASGGLVDASLLPGPLTIVTTMGEIISEGLFIEHFGATMRKIAIGYSIAFVLGTAIGIAMRRPLVEAVTKDWVLATLTMPGLVFALLCAMIFGFSPLGPIVAIVVTSVPYVIVNVAEGARAIPAELLDMADAFGVDDRRQTRHIILPFLAPYLFTALRYGFSIAWKIATLTEVFGASNGIGFMMRREFQTFSMAGMLSWIIFFVVFALFLEVLLQRGIDWFFRWRPPAEAI